MVAEFSNAACTDYNTLTYRLSFDRASVDSKVSQVSQELLGTVLAANEREELGSVIDECGPAVTINEGLVSEQRGEERNVALYSTDTELDKSTENLSAGDFVSGTVASTLHQHRVVVSWPRNIS